MKLSSKFKEGDRIIVTTTKYDELKYPQYLLVGTVKNTNPYYGWIIVKYDTITSGMEDNSYLEEDIELEHVFNSPLYKALL